MNKIKVYIFTAVILSGFFAFGVFEARAVKVDFLGNSSAPTSPQPPPINAVSNLPGNINFSGKVSSKKLSDSNLSQTNADKKTNEPESGNNFYANYLLWLVALAIFIICLLLYLMRKKIGGAIKNI